MATREARRLSLCRSDLGTCLSIVDSCVPPITPNAYRCDAVGCRVLGESSDRIDSHQPGQDATRPPHPLGPAPCGRRERSPVPLLLIFHCGRHSRLLDDGQTQRSGVLGERLGGRSAIFTRLRNRCLSDDRISLSGACDTGNLRDVILKHGPGAESADSDRVAKWQPTRATGMESSVAISIRQSWGLDRFT